MASEQLMVAIEDIRPILTTLVNLEPFSADRFRDVATQMEWELCELNPGTWEAQADYQVVFSECEASTIAYSILYSSEDVIGAVEGRGATRREYTKWVSAIQLILEAPSVSGEWSVERFAFSIWRYRGRRVSIEETEFDGIAPLVALCIDDRSSADDSSPLTAMMYPT